ncbi:TRAP transporter large permease subunit [Ruegeria sp. Ofav3-42]|nr:TRAP transporter large permease subunit [Ruegeria sp. Ofav3-42]
MNVLLLIVGCLMDAMSAIVILAPLLVALGRNFGVDPIHLGIIMIVNLEIGFLTPPMGINLIVAQGAFHEKLGLIMRSVIPFVGLMLIGLIVITLVPDLSLFFL